MVTHDPGEWLEEALEALAAQTYANLSVLVIDTGSAIDPTPRIASVMPGAFVRRLEHNPGYGPALNEVLNLVEGATFFCFCHDDVAPDPDAIHLLVEEAFRSNAGIVGPKLVDWDDPSVLLQVGLAVDRTGGDAPYAERGELDQEQHDAVRDVFTVPGGFTLVRADLFAHLQGFDPGIDLLRRGPRPVVAGAPGGRPRARRPRGAGPAPRGHARAPARPRARPGHRPPPLPHDAVLLRPAVAAHRRPPRADPHGRRGRARARGGPARRGPLRGGCVGREPAPPRWHPRHARPRPRGRARYPTATCATCRCAACRGSWPCSRPAAAAPSGSPRRPAVAARCAGRAVASSRSTPWSRSSSCWCSAPGT